MRTPTPTSTIYAAHSLMIASSRTPVDAETPECGWYKTRMIKGGPWVPVVIWLKQEVDDEGRLTEPESLLCMVGGEYADAHRAWHSCCGRPITKAEWWILMDIKDTDLMRATRVAVDLTESPARP